jgi:hypothetical protein
MKRIQKKEETLRREKNPNRDGKMGQATLFKESVNISGAA